MHIHTSVYVCVSIYISCPVNIMLVLAYYYFILRPIFAHPVTFCTRSKQPSHMLVTHTYSKTVSIVYFRFPTYYSFYLYYHFCLFFFLNLIRYSTNHLLYTRMYLPINLIRISIALWKNIQR